MSHPRAIAARLAVVGFAVLALCGCATPALDAARYNYYAGRFDKADESLESANIPEKDRVLFLMERGTIRQATGKYGESSRDFIEASDLLEKLETYSVSKGTASWVVNDNVQSFRGTPFERTLLHGFTAQNHLSIGAWDDAAVEARRIIRTLNPEVRGEYPEDAYSRYIAGFALEMIDDPSNAGLQYRRASELLPTVRVDESTGHLLEETPSTNELPHARTPPAEKPWKNELVCFILLGRAPRGTDTWNERWIQSQPMHAELYAGGQRLGRSYNLADTVELAFTTDQIEAVRKAAKAVGRVVVKETIAHQVGKENETLGEMVRFVLIGLLEQPDVRRWETLPRWLQVARVPCPADLKDFEIRVVNASGATLRTAKVVRPIARRRNLFFSMWRDTAPAL